MSDRQNLQQSSMLKERTVGDGNRQAAEKYLEIEDMQDEDDCILVGSILVTVGRLTNRL